MHEVQTCIRLVVPFTTVRTRWMFGFQRRFERTCEWLMLTPNDGFLPHTSHTAAMTRFSNSVLLGTCQATREQGLLATNLPTLPVLERLGAAELRGVVRRYR